jgi:hypothetical protein
VASESSTKGSGSCGLRQANPSDWRHNREREDGENGEEGEGVFIGSGGFKSGRNLRELKRGRNHHGGLISGVISGPRLKTTSR